jgi:catechol 2,3-dioxygenase
MKPTHFDHRLPYGDYIDTTLALFTQVLGFELTERGARGPVALRITRAGGRSNWR